MFKQYSGFKVLNLETGEEKIYPYTKDLSSTGCENKAIREQMRLTGKERNNFMISGLIKR